MGRNFLSQLLFATLLACGGEGCRSTSPAHSPYSTHADPPVRDSLASQHANQEGLRHIENGDDTAAEKAFRDALGCDITNAAAHNNLGLLLLRQQRWYEASWEFAYAAKLQPQASAPRGNLGLVFEAVGQYDRAIAEYEEALKVDADNLQVMGHLARTLVKVDRPQEHKRLKELLGALVVKAEPDWSDWARQQLIRIEAVP